MEKKTVFLERVFDAFPRSFSFCHFVPANERKLVGLARKKERKKRKEEVIASPIRIGGLPASFRSFITVLSGLARPLIYISWPRTLPLSPSPPRLAKYTVNGIEDAAPTGPTTALFYDSPRRRDHDLSLFLSSFIVSVTEHDP